MLKRISLQIAIGFLVLKTAVIFSFSIILEANAGLEPLALDVELRELKKAGIPTTIEELIPPPIPDEENAALIYREIFETKKLLYEKYKESKWIPFKSTEPWDKIPEENQKKVIDLILNNSEFANLFKLFEEATSMESQFFSREEYQDVQGFVAASSSLLSQARSSARLLTAKAKIEAESGEIEKALHTSLIALRLAKSLLNQPVLISQLVRMAINAVTLDNLKRVLREGEGNLTPYQSLINEIEEERKRNLTSSSLKGELIIFGLPQFARLEKACSLELCSKGLWEEQRLIYLQTMSRMISLTARPYWETTEEVKRLDEEIQNLPEEKASLTQLLMPALTRVFVQEARHDAMLGNAEIALTLRIYRVKNGHYPTKLSELVPEIIQELPKDPFTGKSHIYRRLEEGFIVYSLGDNAKDDGGLSAKEKHWKGDFDIVWKSEK